MIEQRLELNYKGDRDYLHGTDIFNETLTWLHAQKQDIKDIDFAFHRLARHQVKVILGTLPSDGAELVAVCAFTSGGLREKAYIIETDQLVMTRNSYPEDQIVSQMTVDLATQKGTLQDDIVVSDIEMWVAMTKTLHYKVFQHMTGKWLFVRARIPQFIRHTPGKNRELSIAATFNDKLTRSEALIDGVKVGEIYFTIV